MTQSLYIIGGSGTGKSTFMEQLLLLDGLFRYYPGPLTDLHTVKNARGNPVTLRGHRLGDDVLYLGVLRDSFPGTDGLDRASSIAGEAWLKTGAAEGLSVIVAEGATLATRRFLGALNAHTDLLLVHLVADDSVRQARFAARGSNQDPSFAKNTATRSANLARDIPANVLTIDSGDRAAWDLGLDLSAIWLALAPKVG